MWYNKKVIRSLTFFSEHGTIPIFFSRPQLSETNLLDLIDVQRWLVFFYA